jgi:potassium voltage-gated channel Eag-related subfamily H protein 7
MAKQILPVEPAAESKVGEIQGNVPARLAAVPGLAPQLELDMAGANKGHRSSIKRASLVDFNHMSKGKAPSGSAFAGSLGESAWYIVDPRTLRHQKWDVLITLLLVFTAYVTPYEVTFLGTGFNALFVINRFVDFCFVTDMFKSFFTSFFDVEEQYWVLDLKAITKNYLKSWFFIDFISILPFDSLGELFGSDDPSQMKIARTIRLLRLLKLLRLIRGMRIFDRWQDSVNVTYATKSLTKFFLLLLTVVHWMACALRLLPDLFEYIDSDGNPISWMTRGEMGGQMVHQGSPSRQYALAMYWSSMTLTTIGYGDVSATTDAEAVFMSVCMLVASALYAYSIGEVTNIVTAMDEPANNHNKDSDTLQQFCMESQFSKELTVRLRQYFRKGRPLHRWYYYKELLKKMSPALQGEVTLAMNGKYMDSVPFFRVKDDEENNERERFLSELTTKMVSKLYNAQETVLRKGDTMFAMFLVKSGTAFGCRGTFRVFSVGTWFGTDAVLITGKYAYEVRALNFLIVEVVTKNLLDRILGAGDYPEIWALLRRHAVKAAFKQNFLRYIDLKKNKQLTVTPRNRSRHQLFSSEPLTRRELYYVMHGVQLKSKSEEDRLVKVPVEEKLIGLDKKVDALGEKMDGRFVDMEKSIKGMHTMLSEVRDMIRPPILA